MEILQKEKVEITTELWVTLCLARLIVEQNKRTPMLVPICRIWFNLIYTVSDKDFPL